jgi:hypothetical protein
LIKQPQSLPFVLNFHCAFPNQQLPVGFLCDCHFTGYRYW